MVSEAIYKYLLDHTFMCPAPPLSSMLCYIIHNWDTNLITSEAHHIEYGHGQFTHL